MSYLKKRESKKQMEARLQLRIRDTVKFWGDRYQQKVEECEQYRRGVTELQEACDIMLGHIIKAYGTRNGDALILDVPASGVRFNVGIEKTDSGYELCATEVKDDTVSDDNAG